MGNNLIEMKMSKTFYPDIEISPFIEVNQRFIWSYILHLSSNNLNRLTMDF